jgi:hypothetical protein
VRTMENTDPGSALFGNEQDIVKGEPPATRATSVIVRRVRWSIWGSDRLLP